MIAASPALLSLDDFIRLYDQEGAFEFIDGERIPVMPPIAIHGYLLRTLFRLLDAFCRAHERGEVFQELPFVITYNAQWVKGSRVPDLMMFAAARWSDHLARTPDWAGKPFILVPDLAVEIVSTHDLYTDIQDKVDRYLDDGVRMVWVIDPQRQRVNVYRQHFHCSLFRQDTLDGEDVLPGLRIPLQDLLTLPSA